ncbi:hypothetical protein DD595_25865, partial [Enterobacter cloacae complex sp. 4DZ3-17B2]|uniref:hypothetical protein n=1 Tax=Enterobacter cloacae complex sp. 4DZ3-17B2 TaxID=2511990 RepID=UPI0010280C2C
IMHARIHAFNNDVTSNCKVLIFVIFSAPIDGVFQSDSVLEVIDVQPANADQHRLQLKELVENQQFQPEELHMGESGEER